MSPPPKKLNADADHADAEPTTPNNNRAAQYTCGLRRRRNAAYRLPRYSDNCPCRDPWTCDHEEYVNGYMDAALHLLQAGFTPAPNLPAMREMWRRGGRDRELVRDITSRWRVAA